MGTKVAMRSDKSIFEKYEREMCEAIAQDLLNRGYTKEQVQLEKDVVDIFFENRKFTDKELFNHA